MKKKTVIIAVLVFALLVIAYIVASFCSIRTVDADSLQVLSRKTEDGVLSMDIGIGTSSHVLTGYRFSRETDAIRVTVKKPRSGRCFSLSPRGLPLKSLSSPAWSFPSILRTGKSRSPHSCRMKAGSPETWFTQSCKSRRKANPRRL